MKILHVVEGLEKASGVTTFVENVVAELRALGHEVDVVTKDGCCGNSTEIVAKYDIVHIHGLWVPWLHMWAKATRKTGVKLVWSPHGALTPWALRYKGFKKKIVWLLYQKRDLQSADIIHVTVLSEEEDVRRVGLKNTIIVAPLGVRMNGKLQSKNEELGGGGGGGRVVYPSLRQPRPPKEGTCESHQGLGVAYE